MTPLTLRNENRAYRGRGGISRENRSLGFQPAFKDLDTGRVFPSCFANGLAAPVHVLEGLPDEVVTERSAAGRVVAVKTSVVAGFVWRGRFLTREQAACIVADAEGPSSVLDGWAFS